MISVRSLAPHSDENRIDQATATGETNRPHDKPPMIAPMTPTTDLPSNGHSVSPSCLAPSANGPHSSMLSSCAILTRLGWSRCGSLIPEGFLQVWHMMTAPLPAIPTSQETRWFMDFDMYALLRHRDCSPKAPSLISGEPVHRRDEAS